MATGSRIAYRPDIDGLRAIAVLGVVAYHASPRLLPGGFVGVDVFFVISGYLLTAIFLADAEGGRASILRFYERRVRRILPALLLVLASVTVVALALLPPADLELFGRSLRSVGLLSANRYFWSRTGYFDADAHEQPLLHLWSLAIEEQFYLVWPFVLAVARSRHGKRISAWVLPLLIAVSLALAERSLDKGDAEAAFFLFRGRAWELLLGAWLAMVPVVKLGVLARTALAGGGLAAIAASMIFLDSASRFPGLAAAPACLGAATVILAGREGETTFVSRWLSLKPAVSVGLISYSLYLWHWPLLVLPTLALGRALAAWEVTVALLLAFAVAWLSWLLVERPARRFPVTERGRIVIVGGGAGALVAIFGAGALLALLDGLPARADAEVLAAERVMQSISPLTQRCHTDGETPLIAGRCTFPYGARPTVVLLGDSHAAHLGPRLMADAGLEHGVWQLTKSSCPPILRERSYRDERSAGCDMFLRRAADIVAQEQSVHTLLLSGRWTHYSITGEEAVAGLERLTRLIKERSGRDMTVVVAGPSPDFQQAPGKCFARRAFVGLSVQACETVSPANHVRAREFASILMDWAGRRPNTIFWRVGEQMCPEGSACPTRNADGAFLYRDRDHLSIEGASHLSLWDEASGASSLPSRVGGGRP